MSNEIKLLPISKEDRQHLSYNPNTDDLVDWITEYATQAVLLERAAKQVEIDALTSALAECRDAVPRPPPGNARVSAWGQAMGRPTDVPQYIKETADELIAEIERLKTKQENTVTVSANNLREVLEALLGPPHHIRELQALTGSTVESLTGDTAITALVKEFNAAVTEQP